MKLALGLLGVAVGAGALAVAHAPSTAQNAPETSSGAQAFTQCRACHTLEKAGRNGLGPNLNGLFTRAPASATGFSYSPALKAAGLRWNEKTLNEFLADPRKKVPGTRMPINVADPVKRAAIIAYLKSETAK